MEYRNLEIKVISAKDLKNVNLITKMDVYVVVSISGDPRTKQKTTVDRDGDTNPAWNFPMRFAVEESAVQQNRLSLVFNLICERSLGDKDVGEVHVPFKDLIGFIGDGKLQFVTYQVRKPSGKPKGELNFSYKWGEKLAGAVAPPPAMQVKADEPLTAYPAPVVGPSSAYPYPSPPPPPMQVKADEPPTAYPAPVVGPSSAYPYPPPSYAAAAGSGPYPPPPPGGYPPPPMAGYGYPPPQYGGYPPPPPPGYGYPPPQPENGYPPANKSYPPPSSGGYPPPPMAGYGYPPPQYGGYPPPPPAHVYPPPQPGYG